MAKSRLPVLSWLVPAQVATSAPDLAVTPSSLKKLSAKTTLFTVAVAAQTSPVLALPPVPPPAKFCKNLLVSLLIAVSVESLLK